MGMNMKLRSLRSLVSQLVRYGGKESIAILSITVVLGIFPSIEIFLFQKTINLFLEEDKAGAVIMILVMVAVGIGALVVHAFHPYFTQRFSNAVEKSLTKSMFHYSGKLSVEDTILPQTRNRLSLTAQSVARLSTEGIPGGLMLLQMMISAIAIAIVIGNIILWAPAVILLGVLLNSYFTGKAAAYEYNSISDSAESVRLEKAFFHTLSDLKYAREVSIYGTKEWLFSKWRGQLDVVNEYITGQVNRAALFSSLSGLLGSSLNLIPLICGVVYLYKGSLSAADLSVIFLGGIVLEQFLIVSLMQGKHWISGGFFLEGLSHQEAASSEPDSQDTSAELIFHEVSFTYKNSDAGVLDHINVSIPKGKKIAIVGPNGSGKTTFTNLALSLFEPTKGKVSKPSIGGVCYQDFVRYRMSIKENVMLGNIDCCDDEQTMKQALKISKFDLMHDWDKLIWTEVSGLQLSEGQWQKLALARAMFRSLTVNGSLVVLDEPTAAIDPETEIELLSGIMSALQNYTVLFVVHRMVGCKFADLVMVMNKGKVVSFGEHDDVLQHNELYQQMWEASTSFARG